MQDVSALSGLVGTWISTYLATTFTHVWLLTRVNTLMHRKSRSLNKLLPTTLEIANMWPNTTVDTF